MSNWVCLPTSRRVPPEGVKPLAVDTWTSVLSQSPLGLEKPTLMPLTMPRAQMPVGAIGSAGFWGLPSSTCWRLRLALPSSSRTERPLSAYSLASAMIRAVVTMPVSGSATLTLSPRPYSGSLPCSKATAISNCVFGELCSLKNSWAFCSSSSSFSASNSTAAGYSPYSSMLASSRKVISMRFMPCPGL